MENPRASRDGPAAFAPAGSRSEYLTCTDAGRAVGVFLVAPWVENPGSTVPAMVEKDAMQDPTWWENLADTVAPVSDTEPVASAAPVVENPVPTVAPMNEHPRPQSRPRRRTVRRYTSAPPTRARPYRRPVTSVAPARGNGQRRPNPNSRNADQILEAPQSLERAARRRRPAARARRRGARPVVPGGRWVHPLTVMLLAAALAIPFGVLIGREIGGAVALAVLALFTGYYKMVRGTGE